MNYHTKRFRYWHSYALSKALDAALRQISSQRFRNKRQMKMRYSRGCDAGESLDSDAACDKDVKLNDTKRLSPHGMLRVRLRIESIVFILPW